MKIEAYVGAYRDTEKISSAIAYLGNLADIQVEENIKLFAENIASAIINWLELINSKDAISVYQSNKYFETLRAEGTKLMERAIKINSRYHLNFQLNEKFAQVLEALIKLTRIVIRKMLAEDLVDHLPLESLQKFGLSYREIFFGTSPDGREAKLFSSLELLVDDIEETILFSKPQIRRIV
jgi:plasmid maintenance system killer protein